ncbi:hypothetical protein EJ02DRAFT_439424 [Clathrospora elynae]|uniref:Uncharacterized protein n=1 Tax=Clathrospora elynae TaxID=706981 RepID=A0A6A5S3B4_9PLEO|nr:hypothetical protein EJ02DRAFT_439424 [Clathrospora elynae]
MTTLSPLSPVVLHPAHVLPSQFPAPPSKYRTFVVVFKKNNSVPRPTAPTASTQRPAVEVQGSGDDSVHQEEPQRKIPKI